MVLVRRLLFGCAFLALLVGGWYFAAKNSSLVIIHHPAGEFGEVKLWVALMAAFGSGLALASLVGAYRGARVRFVARRYRKLVAGLQAEVHQLRSLPLSPGKTPATDAVGDPSERGP